MNLIDDGFVVLAWFAIWTKHRLALMYQVVINGKCLLNVIKPDLFIN